LRRRIPPGDRREVGVEKGKARVLLVEDNPDHIEIITSAIKGSGLVDEIYIAQDGEEALDFIFHEGKYRLYENAPRPSLVILDVKLPKENGISVLRKLKANAESRTIPVVIFTTSASPVDIQSAIAEGANSYVIKPFKYNELMDKIERLLHYWFVTNELPARE
jgi:CheY-like chemotaxis protein